jgi:hypothetical protein
MKRKKTRNPDKIALREEKRIQRRNVRLLEKKKQKKIFTRNNIIIAIIVIFIGAIGINNFYKGYLLKRNGQCIVGTIYETGRRFTQYYKFKIRERYYYGHTITDNDKKVGDSLIIVYLPSNPEINSSITGCDFK